MADVTSIYGNPIKDAVARADIATNTQDISDLKDGLTAVESDVTDLKEDYSDILNSAYVTDTASGAIASFPDGADGVPVKSLTVNIEPVQSGSGDPSPDNVRPISGHTSVKVYRTGKNILKTTETTKTQNGVTFTVNSDGSVSVSGTATAFTAFVFGSAQSMGLKHGQRYTINDGDGRTTFQFAIWDATDNVWAARSHNNPNTFTYDSTHALSVQIYVDNGQATNITLYPMIRLASDTDETFAPYQRQEVTIDLDGTRYGGTLNTTTGVLTVDRVLARLGDYSVQYVTTVSCFAIDIGNTDTPSPTAAGLDGCISSCYKSAYTGSSPNLSNLPNNSFVVNTTVMSSAFKRIVIKDTAYTDADAFKTARADVVFVLPLATSQTVQLTAQEIKTVLGQNNIWNDCGDTEVEYRADTKLYIQKVINS